jgi:hypothetical protein
MLVLSSYRILLFHAYSKFEQKVVQALERGRLILERGDELGGFILTNATASTKSRPQLKAKEGTETGPPKELVIYDQFHPLLISSNFPAAQVIAFPTLDEAVDDFFSKIESQKIDLKQVTQVKHRPKLPFNK